MHRNGLLINSIRIENLIIIHKSARVRPSPARVREKERREERFPAIGLFHMLFVKNLDHSANVAVATNQYQMKEEPRNNICKQVLSYLKHRLTNELICELVIDHGTVHVAHWKKNDVTQFAHTV